MANNIPGVNRILPPEVVNQLNALMAEGTAINKVSNTNTEPRNGFSPLQTCGAPNQEGKDSDRENGTTIAICQNGFTRVGTDNFGYHTQCRHQNDIHFRVTQEPE